ncbi:DUF4148 domain-containing protein [Paraburkholderia sp. EG285A]|uniref:DUF4148 domain-containing protein n=1 Tax=Paraburkholderia sp. EG285A TaxID=3237009 RepID=UPI0034D1FD5F
MKCFALSVIVWLLTTPLLAFAQQSGPIITKAQVKEELVQLEQAGYTPSMRSRHYPDDIRAAQARVNEKFSGQTGNGAPGAGSSGSTNN